MVKKSVTSLYDCIEKSVVGTYTTIAQGTVCRYKAVEHFFVSLYGKTEDFMVAHLFQKEGEPCSKPKSGWGKIWDDYTELLDK